MSVDYRAAVVRVSRHYQAIFMQGGWNLYPWDDKYTSYGPRNRKPYKTLYGARQGARALERKYWGSA